MKTHHSASFFKRLFAFSILLAAAIPHLAQSEEIGSVDTKFKIIGANHKIVIEAFDDPEISNVTCYLSRAKTGGIKGSLGLAEDTADAAISCHQVGPMRFQKISKPVKQMVIRYLNKEPR
ncbi:CreA protein [Rosenbergiella nectarea]|uniref:CreA protein n=1 Tax=Rosenbergiella nectarea TaxID=988801 RepID=A0A1H9DU56_9GAMM|nr:CreA protein [Rosenbergiella nectarea]